MLMIIFYTTELIDTLQMNTFFFLHNSYLGGSNQITFFVWPEETARNP